MSTSTAEIADEVATADTVTLGRAANILASKTDKTAEDHDLEVAISAELERRVRAKFPPVHVDNGVHGTVLVGADQDGHGGYVRGIATFAGVYMATDGAISKQFKTLAGAVRYMGRRGYDAHGRRT